MRIRSTFVAALLLACSATAVSAQAPATAATTPHDGKRAEWCTQNPERCAELKAKHEAKCAENPQKCAERRQRHEQRRAEHEARCAQDPQKCAEKKQKFEERRQQCAADPAKCEAERKKRLQKHRDQLETECAAQPGGKACKRLERDPGDGKFHGRGHGKLKAAPGA